VGLVPDNKLLDLLDLALSADTANTVRCMRELLDLGVDALSLVTQLASLITNILAGTFNIHQAMHKKRFFKRNCMPWPIVFVLCVVCFLFWEE
jgi:DNA polymerase III gamma/tau subunit